MPIPGQRRRSYLARQVGTLALAQVQPYESMATVRAAAWHNGALRMGLSLPLFVVADLGRLLTVPRGAGGLRVGLPTFTLEANLVPVAQRPLVEAYGQLLERLAESEVVQRAATWRLRDDLVAMLLVRILSDTWNAFTARGAAGAGLGPASAEELPLDPQLYEGAAVPAHFGDFDQGASWGFLDYLARGAWQIMSAVEQIDLDTVRLLGLFQGASREGGSGGGVSDGAHAGLDLVDLLAALRSPEASDVVDFSLDLLPSILETPRAGGAQTFSVDGYSSVERRGHLDSLILSELAWPDDLFERKLLDQELYYYGRERQHEEEHRLHYVLVDSSASMRGSRQVFARGTALTLAKKLALAGDEVWLRFFDSRLYDVVKVTRAGSSSIPYLLSFRSERGRNYAKVFRQLLLEVTRLRREARRRVSLYIITHGQCHIPVELIERLKDVATITGIILLPSSEVSLEYLPLLDRHQIVSAESLASRTLRKGEALRFVGAATADGPPRSTRRG